MADMLYRKLQEHIDQYSLGFPTAESGIDIEILKKLYTEEEASLFLDISMQKLCALLGRAEIRDLVDVRALEQSGQSLERALARQASRRTAA